MFGKNPERERERAVVQRVTGMVLMVKNGGYCWMGVDSGLRFEVLVAGCSFKHNKYKDFANVVKQSFMAFRKAHDSLLLWHLSCSWEIAFHLHYVTADKPHSVRRKIHFQPLKPTLTALRRAKPVKVAFLDYQILFYSN